MSVRENVFPKVCTEMLEVIKYIPDSEFDKIESDFIETLYQEHDIFYEFKLDESKKLDEQELLPETYDMMAYVYRKYLCNEDEKEEFKENLFKNPFEVEEIKVEEIKSIAIEEKKSIFKKIIEFFKSFSKQ